MSGLVFSSEELALHWRRLDDFEGAEYERARTAVQLDDGRNVTAHVYAVRDWTSAR